MLICINCRCEFDYDSAEKRIIQEYEYDFAFKCTYPSKVYRCPECGSIEWVDTEDKED